VDFRLLGPFEVWHDHHPIEVGHAKQRQVLAVLLVEAGYAVSTATLVDRVWGNDPPDGPLNVVYAYVARLRKVLGPAGVPLIRRSGGYLLDIDPQTVDLHRFRSLLTEADALRAGGSEPVPSAAAAPKDPAPADDRAIEQALDTALALWRGTPFPDAATPWLVRLREALVDQHLSAVLTRCEMAMRYGRHAEVVAPLRELVVEHPVDERPVALLMLVLYRSGRPAEALDVYQAARQRLSEHRGSDPSPSLRQLQQRILRDDPQLSTGETAHPPAGQLPIPAELPYDVPGFVGRKAELARLDALLPASNSRRTVVISAVDGTAGVGKTALAVHWAHRVKTRFRDGSLYADLHGYDPGAPAEPAQVLDHFLAVLEVPAASVPTDLDAKAALYRSLLDERRMLILLDNAASPAQVRPLLPGSPGCLVLVTSRDRLIGLVARDRAQRISLDVLPLDDAVDLLATFIGAERVAAELPTARRLAGMCARLPVALCVAGERVAVDTKRTLAEAVDELTDEQRRLDLLDADGDQQTAVRAVFSWSYDALKEVAARAFRLLGLHPGTEIDGYAMAALAARTLDRAAGMLGALAQAHLIEATGPGRYRMHDLLRAYAAELGQAHPQAERRAALTRLFDMYLAASAEAMDTIAPFERSRRPRVAVPATPLPPMADPAAARAWLELHRPTLVAVARHAASNGWQGHTVALSATLVRYLDGGHYSDGHTIHGLAVEAARAVGDRAAQAHALTNLGLVERRHGRYHLAAEHVTEALALFRAIGDGQGQARSLGVLGQIRWRQNRLPEAADQFSVALDAFRQLGDRVGQAASLGNLGNIAERQGRYDEAGSYFEEARSLYRQIGDRHSEAQALSSLALIDDRRGRYQRAVQHHQEALAILAEIGDPPSQAAALADLGAVYVRLGQYTDATDHLERALTLYRDVGDRSGQAEALNGLGEAGLGNGDLDPARRHHTSALALAVEIGDTYQQARSHDGIARTYLAEADVERAREHWRRALACHADPNTPHAEEIRACLAALDAGNG
jgi:DNA-binding SARP family transcriptional activator/tetratricopeptide (TPR) repeat protein